MHALKRIVAYLIDMAILVLPMGFFADELAASMGNLFEIPAIMARSMWMLQTGVPAQGVLREIIKMLCGMFIFGGLYALYGIITRGKAFYDEWLSLDVEDQKPMGLSERQKKWRQYKESL